MQYTIVFDFARDGAPASSFLYIGLCIAASGLAVMSYRGNAQQRLTLQRRMLLWITWAVVVVVITRIAINNGRKDYDKTTAALKSGAFIVVEGLVTNYQATTNSGQLVQQFDVNDHHYTYMPYRRGIRARRTLPKPPPLRDGSQVRIADIDGAIVRLEVAEAARTP